MPVDLTNRIAREETERPIAPPIGPPLVYDSHVHTWYCQHAVGTVDDYVTAAFGGNYAGIVFTCHTPLTEPWSPGVRMTMDDLPSYLRDIEAAHQNWGAFVDVRTGLECDYAPGLESHVAEVLKLADFDYVLGSVHPQFLEYRERYYHGDMLAYRLQYFEHVAEAAETGLYDAIAHLDVVKEVLLTDDEPWDLDPVLEGACACLDRIAAADVAVELNTSCAKRQLAEFSPGFELLMEIRNRNIPIVLGSDAHTPRRVGDLFAVALEILRDLGFSRVYHYIGRKRIALPIDPAIRSLAPATTG